MGNIGMFTALAFIVWNYSFESHFAQQVLTKNHKILTVERMPMSILFLHTPFDSLLVYSDGKCATLHTIVRCCCWRWRRCCWWWFLLPWRKHCMKLLEWKSINILYRIFIVIRLEKSYFAIRTVMFAKCVCLFCQTMGI